MNKVKELEKRLRDEPQNLGLRVALAGAYREANRMSDAVELYRSVAIAYRDQGRMQQAMAVCKSVLELAPNDAAIHAVMATLAPPPPPPAPVREPVEADVDLEVGTLVAAPTIPSLPTPMPVPARTKTIPPATVRKSMPPEVAVMPTFAAAQKQARDSTTAPKRRSSLDETPLPRALPYHVHDPTTSVQKKLSEIDLATEPGPAPEPPANPDAGDTIPGGELGAPQRARRSTAGFANAARRISASLLGSTGDDAIDVAQELDTRKQPKLPPAQAERLSSQPPPTVPFERADLDEPEEEDAQTPPPLGYTHREEDQTSPRDFPGTRARAPTSSILTTQFFSPLPTDRRAGVLQRFQRRSITGGTVIINQGDIAHPLVLVSKGRLDVRLERADGSLLQIGTIATGEYIGEVALLHRVPAAANVIAAGDVEVLLLPPRDFYELAGAFPALWAELKDVAERRQREYEYRLRAGR